jgi:hypothetical protein
LHTFKNHKERKGQRKMGLEMETTVGRDEKGSREGQWKWKKEGK